MNTTIKTYLDRLIEEKEYDAEHLLEVDGPSGLNLIPLQCVVDVILQAPLPHQVAIKSVLVEIDFFNGDCLDYFRHLAKAMAI